MRYPAAWLGLLFVAALGCGQAAPAVGPAPAWPAALPVYDHIVVVIEENKDYEQIIGNSAAPYLNRLAGEGAVLTRMFGEEHNSQGNYFWLFSGDNQNVGFDDKVPAVKFTAANLGAALITNGKSFKGYAQSLPAIGSEVDEFPAGCGRCVYARKHVPWISFANLPTGATEDTTSNLRIADFPANYDRLPTVAFVIPDLEHDMHNGKPADSIVAGDRWLAQKLDGYYQWARTHNSLLIVTFDENTNGTGYRGLTDPAVAGDGDPARRVAQNRIATVIAGARVKTGFAENTGFTHVNLLRTIEAMYGLPRSGAQQPNAARAGIADDAILTGIFTPAAP
jgi:acid phosphatase